MNTDPAAGIPQADEPFLGLAPFLRLNIAGTDLVPIGQEMLARAARHSGDANLLMNLSIVMQCITRRDIGLALQAEALSLRRVYTLPAARQPAAARLLVLMAPGDVAANTPLECLLEDCDIDLILYYVSPDGALTEPVPAHDALIVAMSAMDQPLLAALAPILAHWPRPVINAPQHIPATERATASRLLQNVPGLLMPPTVPAPRSALLAAAINAAAQCAGIAFPLIVRPLDSQAGRDLAQLASAEALIPYLAQVADADFFVSPFIDYRGADGLFRKFRIALIDGAAFACHMAVSSHWMIHYVNAGMYDEAAKRAEEAAFMEDFPRFAARHAHALAAIQQRAGLDYLCIDCAETPDGQLLIFEIDHVMVVHAMDTAELFPYKQVHMLKVRQAFREFVLRLSAAATTAGGAR